jgi:DNA-binding PadR family transcriptional regulator
MLERAEWMNSASIPVLELLDELSAPVPQATIIVVFRRRNGPSHSTITRALRPLEAHDLVKQHEEFSSLYEITDRGRAYLAGELDASDLEE